MGLMVSRPAAFVGSRPASIFNIPASEIILGGISGTLGLNVSGTVFSVKVPSASPSSTVLSPS